ncbi:SatD family protein [Rapidithrix thailandica]|uniref:SatD family protein n=1 Tax=Rapidithrix thailandica TaxID=413964 RepID=A0AAW9SAG4_9BACT
MSSHKLYFVIIADLIASKEIEDRENFQKDLSGFLKDLSKRSEKNGLVSPYTITLGDEFQAVYEKPQSLFEDVWEVIEFVYPVQIRWAIGYGQITTHINPEQSIGMDGPAFHQARDLMTQLKKSGHTVIGIKGKDLPVAPLANQSLLLLSSILEKWKENSVKICTRLLKGTSIEQIAEELAISPRAVYKNIRTNHIQEVIHLMEILKTDYMLLNE